MKADIRLSTRFLTTQNAHQVGMLVTLAVENGLTDGTNRVVLLTDGQANAGVVDTDKLVALAGSGATRRVSTTCIGFGADFNERLLQPMAEAGSGNYWYVESHDQMAAIFQSEIEGLVALPRGRRA